MRKMDFSDVRWRGAWGAAIAALLFLRMALDHDDGWKLALDLFFACWWVSVCIRFIRLRVIEIEGKALVVTVNGATILDTPDATPATKE